MGTEAEKYNGKDKKKKTKKVKKEDIAQEELNKTKTVWTRKLTDVIKDGYDPNMGKVSGQ